MMPSGRASDFIFEWISEDVCSLRKQSAEEEEATRRRDQEQRA